MSYRKLVVSNSFQKSYLKFIQRNPDLKANIEEALKELEKDAYSIKLKTHKLSGKLLGLSACSCGYDCRIIFSIEKLKESNQEVVLLIDIGTHDEVY